ncbi:MAG: hypothetical protein RLZZ316_1087 [Bacteroidota bacterium]|jgi:hypothetical protein
MKIAMLSMNYKLVLPTMLAFLIITTESCGQADSTVGKTDSIPAANISAPVVSNMLDTVAYNKFTSLMVNGDSSGKWPVTHEYPVAGAVLPFNRVIAYYGNLFSKQMGVLGEYPKKEMLKKLQDEVARWQKADTAIPAIPALHYIAVTAQASPGKGNTYRLRMPFHQIDTVIKWATEINALVFIDIQVGHSTLQNEVPQFEKYFKMPNVHFGIDPEFSMKGGQKPGAAIGTFDAADINYTTEYLAKIVKENNLPPKMLVVHRFTQGMVTNYKQIKLRPEVQIIMDMDGWGQQARKINTYKNFIHREPIQFTGFKLFYKNDFREANSRIMTPEEVLKLKPRPMYIQYQ